MNSVEKPLKTIVKGAGIVFIGIFLSKFFGYFYRLIVARIGVEEYGLLSLGLAVFGFLTIFAMFGMDHGIVKFVSFYNGKKDSKRIKGILKFALKFAIPWSIFMSFLLFYFSDYISIIFFHNENLSIILKILAFVIPLDVFRGIFYSALRGFQKVQYEVYGKSIAENLIKVIFTLVLISFGFGVVGATFAYLFAVFVSLALSLYFLIRNVSSFLKKDIKPIYPIKELLSYSWPLIFTSFLSLMLLWTDTLMLGYFRNPFEVGLYNAASPTAHLMYMFPYALMVIFFPVLNEVYAKKQKKVFKVLYTIVTKWIFIVNSVLLGLFLLFSKELMGFLFGSEYIVSGAVLVILSIGFFFCHLFNPSHYVLLTIKKSKLILINTLIALIFNILLNYYLIPLYGINGAAIATSFSFFIMGVLRYLESSYLTKMAIFNVNYVKLLFAILISLFVIFYLKSKMFGYYKFILLPLLFVFLYGILSILFKAIKKQDLLVLKLLQEKTNLKLGFLNKFIKKFI